MGRQGPQRSHSARNSGARFKHWREAIQQIHFKNPTDMIPFVAYLMPQRREGGREEVKEGRREGGGGEKGRREGERKGGGGGREEREGEEGEREGGKEGEEGDPARRESARSRMKGNKPPNRVEISFRGKSE